MYVGQTGYLKTRHNSHINYEPYRTDQNHSNYPLSKGVRQYGKDNYILLVLEDNIPQEKIDERERYWVAYFDTYYHGYNQTPGGKDTTIFSYYTKDLIDKIIFLLKDTDTSMIEISKLTGVSMTHIWNINYGYRQKRDNENYPIRRPDTKGVKGLKFNANELDNIIEMIRDSSLSLKEIADIYGVCSGTITKINLGKTQAYRKEDIDYPIRKQYSDISQQEADEIIELLKNTELSYAKIGQQFGVPYHVIASINSGEQRFPREDVVFPIRPPRCPMDKDKIQAIQKDLIENVLSYSEIAKKYDIKRSSVSMINTGRTYRDTSLNYPLRINKRIDNILKNL